MIRRANLYIKSVNISEVMFTFKFTLVIKCNFNQFMKLSIVVDLNVGFGCLKRRLQNIIFAHQILKIEGLTKQQYQL